MRVRNIIETESAKSWFARQTPASAQKLDTVLLPRGYVTSRSSKTHFVWKKALAGDVYVRVALIVTVAKVRLLSVEGVKYDKTVWYQSCTKPEEILPALKTAEKLVGL